MAATIQQVKEIVIDLTPEEKQLSRDTITNGYWGSADQEFLDKRGKIETVDCDGYCTNNASRAGHFDGRVISSMFRSIYKKLCPENKHRIGHVISHYRNWWGNGSGDMLFIRREYCDAFEDWARS